MKLKKSGAGLFLIILFYVVFGIVIFILMMLIMIAVNIWVGLAAGLVMGVILGIAGGELEFREHRKMLRKNYDAKKKLEPSEENKVIAFPGNYSDSSSSSS